MRVQVLAPTEKVKCDVVGGRERRTPGSSWTASLITEAQVPGETLSQKNKVDDTGGTTPDVILGPHIIHMHTRTHIHPRSGAPTCAHMHTNACLCIHIYTYAHIQRKKKLMEMRSRQGLEVCLSIEYFP